MGLTKQQKLNKVFDQAMNTQKETSVKNREIIDNDLYDFIVKEKGLDYVNNFDFSEFNTLLDEIQEGWNK